MLPRLRWSYGWVARRSAWMASVRARTAGGRSSWTRQPGGDDDVACEVALESGVAVAEAEVGGREGPPRACPWPGCPRSPRSTSSISVPKAPALPRTEAPQVPGNASSRYPVPSTSAAQSSAARGIIAPPGMLDHLCGEPAEPATGQALPPPARGCRRPAPGRRRRRRSRSPAPRPRGTGTSARRRWPASRTRRYQLAGTPIPYSLCRSRGLRAADPQLLRPASRHPRGTSAARASRAAWRRARASSS